MQWNTVGEIRGSEHPDEVVLLGAHLDSWDIGTGATDNATGSIAVLEAARLFGVLKASTMSSDAPSDLSCSREKSRGSPARSITR